ncbi:MAG: hypothetical protein LAO09_15455 [Acidobacteriia bacterium]|nr:hypothetical protein [Terriglobia bacterium]
MKCRRHLRCWLCAAVTASFLGCGVPGAPKPPSLNLPQRVTDLRAVRRGDSVYLAWTVPTKTTDSVAVRHLGTTKVCRNAGSQTGGCESVAGEVAPPPPTAPASKAAASKNQGSLTDVLPQALLSANPSAQIFYAVSVANTNGRSAGLSNIVAVPGVRALPPPADFRAQVTADGVLLSWTGSHQSPDTLQLRHVYRVYRREKGKNTDTTVGEMPFATERTYLMLDHSFEWERSYNYRATVVALIRADGRHEVQFEGDDTPAAAILVHDTFAPAVPAGLQAVFSGIGQQPFIDLIWAPGTDADLAGYNIYRREADGKASKINSQLVKTPAFRDGNVASGHTYIYSVSAVDTRGNESALSGEASEQVP